MNSKPLFPAHPTPDRSEFTVRSLVALPIFNEATSVDEVLDEVARYSDEVLVVDDGSSDGTAELLRSRTGLRIVSHDHNLGYGAALQTAFRYAVEHRFDVVVTIDCDGQHEPQRIPQFAAACSDADIVSGSRYLKAFPGDNKPPEQRRRINSQITAELNRRLGLQLTDAFCGFKAYRVDSLKKLALTERGYAMPLELWVQAACANLKIVELPVPLIYLDQTRSFGDVLDDPDTRVQHYHDVLERSIAAVDCRVTMSVCGEGAG
jgi:dolichol-phosphate mannosyltransferase